MGIVAIIPEMSASFFYFRTSTAEFSAEFLYTLPGIAQRPLSR
jgi:hypothetical protein